MWTCYLLYINKDQTTTPGTLCPSLCKYCQCGFFNIPQLCANKGCKTGCPAYSPYLRRLESLTICRCNNCNYSEQWSGQSPTRNLMRDSPILSQLSHQCTIQLTYIRITYILYKLGYLSEPFLGSIGVYSTLWASTGTGHDSIRCNVSVA